MFIYPYKAIKKGKFTKYMISITEDKQILVQKTIKGKKSGHRLLENQKAIKTSDLPKDVMTAALWALNDAPNLGL